MVRREFPLLNNFRIETVGHPLQRCGEKVIALVGTNNKKPARGRFLLTNKTVLDSLSKMNRTVIAVFAPGTLVSLSRSPVLRNRLWVLLPSSGAGKCSAPKTKYIWHKKSRASGSTAG